MEKEKLIELIETGYSVREIKNLTSKGYSTIRYWLNKFDLKTLKTKKSKLNKYSDKKICKICNMEKDIIDFYKSGNRIGTYCKFCSNLYHTNRVRDIKIKMVNYKGGKCEDCNLQLENSHYSVFEFHHLDPKEKDPNFGKVKFWRWNRIKNEIDKCKLLCANCHRLEHAVLSSWGKVDRIVDFKKDKEINKCDCGNIIHLTSNTCKSCLNNKEDESKRKVKNRPPLQSLLNDVDDIGFSATGRKYGVSDNCIRKWIKKYQKIEE